MWPMRYTRFLCAAEVIFEYEYFQLESGESSGNSVSKGDICFELSTSMPPRSFSQFPDAATLESLGITQDVAVHLQLIQ
jgi:hypothetical protein